MFHEARQAPKERGWHTIEPIRTSKRCGWCTDGYHRVTNGSEVLHDLPEPAGMTACLEAL